MTAGDGEAAGSGSSLLAACDVVAIGCVVSVLETTETTVISSAGDTALLFAELSSSAFADGAAEATSGSLDIESGDGAAAAEELDDTCCEAKSGRSTNCINP